MMRVKRLLRNWHAGGRERKFFFEMERNKALPVI
jgi:hypothetical protein